VAGRRVVAWAGARPLPRYDQDEIVRALARTAEAGGTAGG
jgi:hypothetical protein